MSWILLSETGDRAVDEAGVVGARRVIVDPEFPGHSGPVGLHQYVGPLDEPARHVLPGVPGQVDGDAALVAIHAVEVHAHGAIVGRIEPPVVAYTRLLHLDHVGAHVAQGLGGPGAREQAAEVDDLETGER
jgi:hypothetical protein